MRLVTVNLDEPDSPEFPELNKLPSTMPVLMQHLGREQDSHNRSPEQEEPSYHQISRSLRTNFVADVDLAQKTR